VEFYKYGPTYGWHCWHGARFCYKGICLIISRIFLVYMAVAGRKNLNVELKEVTSTSKEIEHEKVDARL
jgi:hypothetical protein